MSAKIIGFLAALLLLINASVSHASMLYICNDANDGVSHLYSLTTAGAATKVGDILKDGTSNLDIRDVAYSAKTGVMYAITTSSLYTLNFLHPSGGVVVATLVGSTGAGNLQGLTVAPDGTIYAGSRPSGATGSLYTLNSSTGVATKIGDFGDGGITADYLRNAGDLAFSNTGTLYGTFVWYGHDTTNNYLATASTGSGAASPIGAVGGTTTKFADGLTFMDGVLYSCSPNKLYTLNTSTGIATTDIAITENGTSLNYITGMTTVPLPGSVCLFLTGLTGLGLLGWRRKGRTN